MAEGERPAGMQVVWKNLGPVKDTIFYECAQCKLEFCWRKDESSYYEKEIMDKKGGTLRLMFCSKECHDLAKTSGLIDKFSKKKT